MAHVLTGISTGITQALSPEMPVSSEAVLAEALFASTVQASECPEPDQVRRAVATTLRRLSSAGCAGRVATEYGDHPEAAVARMSWALATIRTASMPRMPTAKHLAAVDHNSRARNVVFENTCHAELAVVARRVSRTR
jgi:hypothetical protein